MTPDEKRSLHEKKRSTKLLVETNEKEEVNVGVEGISEEASEEKQNPGSSFDDELFVKGQIKERMTIRQKRAAKRRHQLAGESCRSLDKELKNLQDTYIT